MKNILTEKNGRCPLNLKTKRILDFDIVKGLGIVLVVMGHLIQRTALVEGQDFYAHYIFKWIYIFHMSVFFFLSGCLLRLGLNPELGEHSFENKSQSKDSLQIKLKSKSWLEIFLSRTMSLVLPYLSWTLVNLIILAFLHQGVDFNNPLETLTKAFFTDPLIWFLWTLWMCMSLILFCYAISKSYTVILALGLIILMGMIKPAYFAKLYFIQWYFPFLVLGFFIPAYNKTISPKLRNCLIFLSVITLSIAAYFWSKSDFIYIHQMNHEARGWLEILMINGYHYVLSVVGIILIFQLAKKISSTRGAALLAKIGQMSLGIYLVQRLLVEGLYEKIYIRLGFYFDVNSFLFNVFILPVLTAMFLFICYLITSQFLNGFRLTRWLLLGHKSDSRSEACRK